MSLLGAMQLACHYYRNILQQTNNTRGVLIVKPKSSPQSKSQIQVPNPKSKVQRKLGLGLRLGLTL